MEKSPLFFKFSYDIIAECKILFILHYIRKKGFPVKESFKQTVKEFYNRYKHAWVLLYGFIYFPWFGYLEQHVTTRFNVIHMAIDDYIPFVEFFIVPYLLWFGYVAYAIFYFFFKNKNDYYKLCTFLFTGMTVFLVISTLYPNGHYLRPDTFTRDNVFTHLVQFIYSNDTATNLFPSIHVYNSLGVHFAICNSKNLRENKRVRSCSFVLMVGIILATMFLKQHSVFDVITAFVMAFVMYSLVYGKNFQLSHSKVYEKQLHHI